MKESEHQHQVAYFDVLRLNEAKYPFLKYVFAVPNGSHRHIAVAAKLKKEGVKSGIFDIFVCFPKDDYGGLFLEFKYGRNKLTDSQKEFREYAERHYATAVCYSWTEAVQATEEYLEIKLLKL